MGLAGLQEIRCTGLVLAMNKRMVIYARDVCSQRSDAYLCNGERFVFPMLEVGQCQTISETLPNVLKPMRLRRVAAYTSVVTGAC